MLGADIRSAAKLGFLAATAATAVVVTMFALSLGRERPSAVGATGCDEVAEGAIHESQRFTPVEEQRGGNIGNLIPLNPSGLSNAQPSDIVAATKLGGLDLQLVLGSERARYEYFLDRPIDRQMTPPAFIEAGGIQLERESNAVAFPANLLEAEPVRATPVEVGPYQGALTWADPLPPNGVRTHNLYWFDGKANFALIADRSAAVVINLARSIVCG